ncbi:MULTISPECIES: hypothetical protein [unclassified Streptomyces]|uniref:hypothetical protein n=1 Tax=unclassified Streptomyces TaxID=2593676 RepID=UPI0036F6B0DE
MFGQPAKSETVTCGHCGAELEQTPGAGRVRRFCNGDHGKAYRARMRALGFPV